MLPASLSRCIRFLFDAVFHQTLPSLSLCGPPPSPPRVLMDIRQHCFLPSTRIISITHNKMYLSCLGVISGGQRSAAIGVCRWCVIIRIRWCEVHAL